MKRWDGVADGTRTHDDQNHNLGLYQLSYSHRRARNYKRRHAAPTYRAGVDAAPTAASATFVSTFSRRLSAS